VYVKKVLILVSLFVCHLAIGQPQPKSYNVYLDTDNRSTTGCTVLQPNFATQFDGVDGYISISTGDAPVAITGALYHKCTGGVFDAGSSIVTSALGLNASNNGHDVFEAQMATTVLGIRSSANAKLYFTTESSTSSDIVVVNNNGSGIFAAVAFPIPIFSLASLLLFILIVYIVAKKAHKNKTLIVASVLLFSTVVWGMFTFVIDGQVDDWSSFTAINDPLADNSAPGDFSDITQVFANLEQDLFTARIDVVDVENQAPTITSAATAIVVENQTAVVDVNSTDLDGDTEGAGLTYIITGTIDDALFSIDMNTGVVTFLAAPDFEMPSDVGTDNDYNLQVTVTDSGGATDAQDIVVSVTNDLNDDATVAFQSAASSSVDEATTLNIVVVLSTPVALTTPLSVDVVDATGGTATTVTDYNAVGTQTVTFPIGAVNGATMNVAFVPVNDNNVENDETVNLVMQNVSAPFALGTQISHTATITEDDTATVSFQATTSATVNESTALSVPVLLTIANGGQLDVAVTVEVIDATGGSAASGVDYATIGTQLMTFAIGSANGATQNATLTPTDDANTEGNETVNLALQNITGPTAASIGAQASHIATITDDEASVQFQTTTSSTVNETTALNVAVVLTTPIPLSAALSVDVVYTGTGTATSGNDFTAIGTQLLTFPIGSTNGTILNGVVTPTNDSNVENNETLQLRVQNLVGTGSLGAQTTHVVTIVEDDVATVSFQAATSATADESTALSVPVLLTIPSGGQLDVAISVAAVDAGGGSAISATDYSAFGTQTVTFNVGSTNGSSINTILTPLDDATPESGETVNLQIQNLIGPVLASLGAQTTHLATITDDDNQAPTANNDAYNVTGNVGLNVPAGAGVVFNDTDPDMDTLTVTAFDATSSQGGLVSVNADGSFTYVPPVGYTGADSFTYTMTDGSVNDSATVNLTLSNKIWFIDSSLAAAGNGSLATPFNTLAGFEAINGNGSALQPAAGECIYLESGSYIGPLTLENAQTVVGKGSSTGIAAECGITLAVNSMTLPATGGTRPVITSAGNGINLASGNTLRGFDIGNAVNKLVGNNFGLLTINNMALTTTGKAVDLTTGTAAIIFDSVTTTSSASEGIDLNTVAGTFTVTNAVNISNSASAGISIVNSTGNFAYSGNLNITSGGIFMNGNNAGSTTFSGTSKIINTGTSTAVNLNGNTGHSIRFINGGLDVDATTGTSFNVISTSTPLVISGAGNSLTTASGEVINISNANTNIVVDTASQTAGINNRGIDINNHSGTLIFSGGVINNSGGNEAIEITGGNSTINIATAVNSSGNGLAIDISGRTGGNITLSGNLSDNNSVGGGINVSSNSGGTIILSGTSKVINTVTNVGVLLQNNTGATIEITNGGLDIDTTTANAFNATGGGTLNVSGMTNTVTSTSGNAINIINTNIGASDITFQSVSSNGGDTGIILTGVGGTGYFNVFGTGLIAGSGGTIQNTALNGMLVQNSSNMNLFNMNFTNANTTDTGPANTNAALEFNSSANIQLRNLNISGHVEHGILGVSVTNFDILNSTITGTGADTETNEHGIFMTNLLGTGASSNLFDNITLNNSQDTGILIINSTGTSLLDVQNSTINSAGDSGINLITSSGAANLTVNVTGNSIIDTVDGVSYVAEAGVLNGLVGGAGLLANNISAGVGGDMVNGIRFFANGIGLATMNVTAADNIITLDAVKIMGIAPVNGLNGVGVATSGQGTIRATVQNNVISSSFSGILTQTVHGVFVNNEGTGTTSQNVVSIDNNTITLDPTTGTTTAETVGIGVDGGNSGGGITVRSTNNSIIAEGDASNGASVGVQILPTDLGDPAGTNNRVCIALSGNNVSTPNNPFAGAFLTGELDVIVAPVAAGSFLDVEGIALGVKTTAQIVTDIEAINASTEVGDPGGSVNGTITGVMSCPN